MNILIAGKVVKGEGYGKKLGFPTVNLDTMGADLPKDGVYSGEGEIEGEKYKAGIVIGPNKKVEAHLLGFSRDAYGKIVVLEIREFLREYKKFESEEKLIEQIKKDLEKC